MASYFVDNSVFIERVRHIVDRCGGNIARRRAELSQVRAEYMVARMVAKLRNVREFSDLSEAELIAAASRILEKAGARSVSVSATERRTDDEEKLIGSAKVSWHKLLKAEGLAPVRPWSKATGRGPTRSFGRQIAKPEQNSEDMRETFQRYVARQALHLLNACAEARSLDQAAVPPRIEQIVAALYAACVSASPGSLTNSDEK